jgi:hypothetical protein
LPKGPVRNADKPRSAGLFPGLGPIRHHGDDRDHRRDHDLRDPAPDRRAPKGLLASRPPQGHQRIRVSQHPTRSHAHHDNRRHDRRPPRLVCDSKNQALANFGFTPAQIQAHNEAIDGDAAGIGAGQFKGTVEPTVDASHHINGGCRAINAEGSEWFCYLGQAAIKQKIVTGLGAYVPSPGVG